MASDSGTSSSNFAEAFSGMKESKFYDKPKEKPTSSSNCLVVNPRQKGNPALKHIHNVPWEYGDIIPDYVMGTTTCCLFLSLKCNNLYPDYIHQRLKDLGQNYALRVLLVLVDISDPHPALKELTKMAVLADCTLLLGWSFAEIGKYLETFKVFENKSADLIMEKQDANPCSKVIDSLTSIRSVNKTDALTLLNKFGNLNNIIQASEEELALCPGIGLQKASRLFKVLHQPFVK